jgi:hypothetical protein
MAGADVIAEELSWLLIPQRLKSLRVGVDDVAVAADADFVKRLKPPSGEIKISAAAIDRLHMMKALGANDAAGIAAADILAPNWRRSGGHLSIIRPVGLSDGLTAHGIIRRNLFLAGQPGRVSEPQDNANRHDQMPVHLRVSPFIQAKPHTVASSWHALN